MKPTIEIIEKDAPQRRAMMRLEAMRHNTPGRRMHAVITTTTEVVAKHWAEMEKVHNGARPRSRTERGTRIETWRMMFDRLVRTHGYLAGTPRKVQVAWSEADDSALEKDPHEEWISHARGREAIKSLMMSESIRKWVIPDNEGIWLIDEADLMNTDEEEVFETLKMQGTAKTIIIGRTQKKH